MVLAGAFNISFWLIPGSMMPDVTDWDPSKGRERREGAYYGVWTLLRKTSLGAAYGVIGLVLAGAGYVPDAAQSATVLLWLRLLFGPIPAMLLLLGAIVFVRFPITRQAQEALARP
jgi:GPH family glycoside/pentoside/hexuronide:cation symporter